MNSKTAKVMAAFVLGQLVQIVLAVLAKVSFMSKPVMFCIAAGFLILLAVVAGITLADSEKSPAHEKSYKEWANGRDTDG